MNVGIDIGTTYTVVYYTDIAGHLIPIEFEHGKHGAKYLLPSCFTEIDQEIYIGQTAIDKYRQNPCCSNFFRYDTDKKAIVIEYILEEIKKELSSRFGDKEYSALVAVSCDNKMIHNVLDKVGFINKGIVFPPFVAAAAYSRTLFGNVLVADFGGGSLELAVVRMGTSGQVTEIGQIIQLSKHICTDISGKWVDDKLVNYVQNSKSISDNGYKVNISPDSTSPETPEVINASNVVRDYISDTDGLKSKLYVPDTKKTYMFINSLYENFNLNLVITNDEYENTVGPEFSQKLRDAVVAVLKSACLKTSDISKVIVTGGMARELCLSKLLDEIFTKRVAVAQQPLTATAMGAAICNNNICLPTVTVAHGNLAVVVGDEYDYILHSGDDITNFHAEREYQIKLASSNSFEIALIECKGDETFDANKHPLIKKEVLVPAEAIPVPPDVIDIRIAFRFVDVDLLEAEIQFNGSNVVRKKRFEL